jgi:hypothetical protein
MRFSFAAKALLLIVLVPLPATALAAQTYSDVREVDETGDLVGTELALQMAAQKVTGTLWHYEGTEPEPILLDGRIEGEALTLSGSYSGGKVEIAARLKGNRILGKLSFHLPGQTNDVELNLPRVDRPRMHKTAVARVLL